MGLLTELANRHRTDKGTAGTNYHGFTEFYEPFLEPVRMSATRILEIGVGVVGHPTVAHAASLLMWRDYFPNAHIYACDVDPARLYQEDRITSCVCDQSNPESLQEMIKRFGSNFDLIVDDGSHNIQHQQITLTHLFQHVRPGGFYIVEDLHTSTWGWGWWADHPDGTLNVLRRLSQGQPMESSLMGPEASKGIEQNTSFCKVWENGPDHATGIILKK